MTSTTSTTRPAASNGTAPALRGGASSAPGSWFLLWGMLLLSIWMAPAPDSATRLMVARIGLALVAVFAAIAAGLRLKSGERAGAPAGFLRSAGALMLGAGLWATNARFVIESVALRATLLTLAGLCLLISLALDLARDAR